MNLLIKDTCNLHENKEVLDNATEVVKYVKNKHTVAAKFQENCHSLKNGEHMVLPVDTRWYTHFNRVDGLLKARTVFSIFVSSGDLDCLYSVSDMKFKNTLDCNVWEDLRRIRSILEMPSNLIGN